MAGAKRGEDSWHFARRGRLLGLSAGERIAHGVRRRKTGSDSPRQVEIAPRGRTTRCGALRGTEEARSPTPQPRPRYAPIRNTSRCDSSAPTWPHCRPANPIGCARHAASRFQPAYVHLVTRPSNKMNPITIAMATTRSPVLTKMTTRSMMKAIGSTAASFSASHCPGVRRHRDSPAIQHRLPL